MQTKLNFIFPERPNESLEVTAAFAENPDAVEAALWGAIRSVGLRSHTIRIADIFWSVLQKPWKPYKPLPPLLNACLQGKYGHTTERLFHKNAGLEGIVALALVGRDGKKVLDEIDELPEEELIKLAKLVGSIPKKASMQEFIDEFGESTRTPVPVPIPIVSRPRHRSVSTKPEIETSDILPHKRQKLNSIPKKRTYCGVGVSSPTQASPPSNQNHTRPPDYNSNASASPSPDAGQQLSVHQDEQWSQTGGQSTDDPWDFEWLTDGRPSVYPQTDEWNFESTFNTVGRPIVYPPHFAQSLVLN